MDWKREAIEELEQLHRWETAIQSIPVQIAVLESDYTALAGTSTDRIKAKGGEASRREDGMLDNVMKRERLAHQLHRTQRTVAEIRRALQTLNERERRVLEELLVAQDKGGMSRLSQEWSYEKSQIYRIRDRALYHFTVALYGLE